MRCSFYSRIVMASPLALMFGIAGAVPAMAGNEANSVLYSHHTEPNGETEINVFNDFSRGAKDLPKYNAQLFEIEHAFTDLFWARSIICHRNKVGVRMRWISVRTFTAWAARFTIC